MSDPKTKRKTKTGKVIALVPPLAEPAPEVSHLSIANEVHAISRKIGDAVRIYRERVQTPFGSRMPTDADALAAFELMQAIGEALWGWRTWDDVRTAHAAMRAKTGSQDRHALALERCAETLVAWRKLDRKRRRRETADAHAQRMTTVESEEKWLAKALTLALRELGYKPRNVAPLLREIAARANGSPVSLALRLLDVSEDALRTAGRKKRQTRSK